MQDGSGSELTTLEGKVTYIVFRNEETFYTVLRVKLNEGGEKSVTMRGILPQVEKDRQYRFTGLYTEHPRYGLQFEIHALEPVLPSEREGVVRYLCGVQFPGIGRRTAQRIVDTLGAECMEDIRADASVLKQVPGLSEEKIRVIEEGLAQEEEGMSELVTFLNVQGIGTRNMIRLSRTYGKEALNKLKENPYRVIEECDGFGFVTADKIAAALGVEKDDPRRLYALLVSLCMDLCVRQGDSYVEAQILADRFVRETEGLNADYEDLLEQALIRRSLVQEENRIYPVSQYDAEKDIAVFLAGFLNQPTSPVEPEVLQQQMDILEQEYGILYDEKQREAVRLLFASRFLILTGGPGTGKTTVVRALVALYQRLFPGSTVLCAAPTGRAAKHLAEVTGTRAQTIHALLKWDLETNTFGVNEENPLAGDLLILDEFSMVDTWLFANLLKACGSISRICLIGDEDQLPSVGPGCVLRDLIADERFSLVRLEHIYRQKEGSDVITLARQIHDGGVDFSQLKENVRFVSCPREQIRPRVVEVVESALTRGYSLADIQVLSPMYSGSAGIDVLNNALQEAFNPPGPDKKECRFGYLTFREGDKILQLKNQPDDDVYNGDIGVLEEVYGKEETENHQPLLVVHFDEGIVEYTPETMDHITLAYCISVHKSQGNEYPIVIMPVTWQFRIMLQKKLLYTGVTRARSSLVLIGEEEAFRYGVEKGASRERRTTLKEQIDTAFSDLQAEFP
jgi:exodeoxyribonuclease V alpha subunit